MKPRHPRTRAAHLMPIHSTIVKTTTLATLGFASLLLLSQPLLAGEPKNVSFTNDVLPILQKNCLACHSESDTEGELILESAEQLLEGGDSGPAVIPGNAEESLLYQLAAHAEEPYMPPVDNDVGAKELSPEALTVLKSWIDQGAKDDVDEVGASTKIDWRPIADEFASILALELSPDGRWLATGRGNRLMVYSIPQKKLDQTLVDPNIIDSHPDSAHFDSVQSITWSPDQTLIASGGYRVVKIWQRQSRETNSDDTPDNTTEAKSVDETLVVRINDEDATVAKLIKTADNSEIASLNSNVIHDNAFGRAEFLHGLLNQRLGVFKADLEAAKKRKTEAEKDVTNAAEEIKKATEEAPKKKEPLAKATEAFDKIDATVKEHEAKKTVLTSKIEKLDEELAAADESDKAKLEKDKKSAEQDRKTIEVSLANKNKERDKLKKDLDKKQQEFTDAEKAVERSIAAKQRLEKMVITRQEGIAAAELVLNDLQSVVDKSAQALEQQKQQPAASWSSVGLSNEDSEITLVSHDGQAVRYSATDGKLLSIERNSQKGEWKLIKTLGAPDDPKTFTDRITSLAFRHDGKVLAVGGGEPSRSGEVQLWDTTNWSLLNVVADIHSDVVYDLQFAPLGNNLVSCGSDRMVKLIDTETAKPIRTFEGHTGHVLGVSWRADGRTLATAGADKVVKVWDAKEGGQKKTISGFKGEVTAVRYLGLENRMVFSTGQGELHSRDSEGNSKQGFGKLTDYVHRVSASRDGKIVAAAGTNRVVRIWNSEGKQIAEFK